MFDPPIFLKCPCGSIDEPGDQHPLSFLLGIRRQYDVFQQEVSPPSNCSETEYGLPDGSCRPILCRGGKLMINGTCVTALPHITGLGYRIHLLLEYKHFITVDTASNMSHVPTRDHMIDDFRVSNYHVVDFKSEVIIYKDDKSNAINFALVFDISFRMREMSLATRDSIENDIDHFISGKLKRYVNDKGFEFAIVTGDIVDACSKMNDRGGMCVSYFEPYIELNMYDIDIDWLYVEDLSYFLEFSPTNMCSYVVFDNSSFHVVARGFKEQFILKLKQTNDVETSSQIPGRLDKEGNLQVCVEDLDAIIHPVTSVRSKLTAKAILTYVCIGCSCVCLVLTILTYVLFKSLRSLAGKNNVCLCSSLLLAQIILLITYNYTTQGVLCKAFGILTHYSWLCMFSWSFVCCFHMFKVFTAKTRASFAATQRSQAHIFLANVAFTFTVPALIVGIVVAHSYFSSESGQRTIGYGTFRCYLDSVTLVGVAMLLPLVVVVVSNILLFGITIFKINSIRSLQTSDTIPKNNMRNFYIYLKLSSLTGSFWSVVAVDAFIGFEPLTYVYIVLNGLQGVFIFVSYVCNKRVFDMYRSLLRSQRQAGPENSTQDLTLSSGPEQNVNATVF